MAAKQRATRQHYNPYTTTTTSPSPRPALRAPTAPLRSHAPPPSAMRVLMALAAAGAASAAYCGGGPKPDATPNAYPIADGVGTMTLLKEVPNGKAYLAGPPGFEFHVLHFFGSAYEMGFAHGQLVTSEVRAMVNETWAYMESQVTGESVGARAHGPARGIARVEVRRACRRLTR